MNSQESTDLETLALGEKVVNATRNIFKLKSNYAQIINYLEHSKQHKHQLEVVQSAFQDIVWALNFLEEKMTQDHTPRFRYAGK